MRGRTIKTPANIARAQQLRAKGLTDTQIARVFGLKDSISIKAWLDPSYLEKRREIARGWRRTNVERTGPCPHLERYKFALERDARKLMKQIPPDTRDLTAQLCGDPIPGRRAIDKIEMKLGKH